MSEIPADVMESAVTLIGRNPHHASTPEILVGAAVMAERERLCVATKALNFDVVGTPYEQGWNHALGRVIAAIRKGEA